MKKSLYLSLICVATLNLSASDLGVIQVESSTIDDKFNTNMLEVSSTTTMDGEVVEEYHAENISKVLNTIPGVTVRENEGDSNKIHIRGIATEMYMGEKPGVAIVIDGVPVQERAGSVNIDSDNIESIKIIKGGASYLYGNDALAGAVIITTKKPKNKTGAFLSTEVGSYGYLKSVARANAASEDVAVEIQGSYKKSDGYWEDSDYWTKSINGKLQYYIDDSSDITLGLDRTKRYENDTGSITYKTYNPDTGVYTNNVKTNPESKGEVGYSTDYDIDLAKYFLTYSKDFNNGSNLMAQIYSYDDTTTNQSSAFDSTGDGLRDDHKYLSYADTMQQGFKSEYRMDGDIFASMIGVDIARNEEDKNSVYRVDYDSRYSSYKVGDVSSDTSSDEDINAIYGEVKYGVTEKLTTTFNARYDSIDYDYTNNLTDVSSENTFNEMSYRLGATYKLQENQVVFTNYSTGFRVPLISQMYAGDIYGESYSGTYVNNKNISTEKTYNYEIGFRGKTDLISYEISIYQLNRDDVIGKSVGNYASTNGDEDLFYDNIADIRNRGVELGLNSDRSKAMSFVFNYTYLDSVYTRYDNYYTLLEGETTATRYDVTNNTVPRTSKHTVYVETSYKPIRNLTLTAALSYRSSQYADERNEIKVDGYSVVNLRSKYNMKISDFSIQLFAQVDNVLDKQYYMMPRVTGDRNDDGLYDIGDMGLTVNPGRVYLAGLSITY